LSQWWTPPLRLQVSDCSTFLMMCGVPSTEGFFCGQSVECPGILRFLKLLLTINVAAIIIIIIIIISCHRFSFFPGTSPFEPLVNK
jgi:hypothetical protein